MSFDSAAAQSGAGRKYKIFLKKEKGRFIFMSLWYILILCVIAATICYVFWNYSRIKKMPEGTPEMAEMAGIIRSGANTFMKTEYRTIAIVVLILAVVLSLFVERTSGITFLMGALMSSIVCVLGMRSATYANVRTANKARESMSIGETVKVALCGGSISGLSVQAFGLLGFILVLMIFGNVDPAATGGGLITTLEGINPTIMHISTYSLGCSLVAMFNRVAGGNYTKAADISADILAKVRNDLPEDDSRVPNVIADFIGDNVNDIAGNCSDLLESFVATVAASLMIAVVVFHQHAEAGCTVFGALTKYPVVRGRPGPAGLPAGPGLRGLEEDERQSLPGAEPGNLDFRRADAGAGILRRLDHLRRRGRRRAEGAGLGGRLDQPLAVRRAGHRQRRGHRLHHRILHLHGL